MQCHYLPKVNCLVKSPAPTFHSPPDLSLLKMYYCSCFLNFSMREYFQLFLKKKKKKSMEL